jgi:uncharacterized protein RhaS with RHS repeats
MRYRDLYSGTFLTRDPIGYGDGPNVYCYVHCNPITQFDAFGLSGWLIIETRSEEGAASGGVKSSHSWIAFVKDGGGLTTWGTFGNRSGKEKRKGLNKNTELKDGSQIGRAIWIDDAQEESLYEIVKTEREKGKKAWRRTKNCSSFSQNTWNEVTGENVDASNGKWIDTPKRLGDNLKELNGGKAHLKVPKQTLSSSAMDSAEEELVTEPAPAEERPVTEPAPVVDDDQYSDSL